MIDLNTAVRISICASLVPVLVALSAPAFAADDDAVPHAALSIRGVDFNSPRAVAHLKGRLRQIATGICAPDVDGHMPMSTDARTCYDTAIRNGLAQIDSREQQAMREHAVMLADARPAIDSAN